ncbi:MAG TPA: RdgB/HAM1 family non-canonical purine NTP pyrophosphatase [Myxococcales bacterium]|jgi:XTP/dITP diphosphohydrolase|nr:RdgB/HAM1 family non-canonical purine NTP pyrophosphatase [Myxococcales bacterium]
MILVVATGNAGKLVELRELLTGLDLSLRSLAELGLPSPEETGNTFAENAELKARAAATFAGTWALGDDSGLCVDALGGAPGLHSARYASTDEARRARLLRELAAVPAERRGAHFFCAAALCAPDGRIFRAEGRVYGAIAFAPRGTNGFGYDPLFLPAETPGLTLAELPSTEKNRLSHRGRAVVALRPVLEAAVRGR